MGLRPTKGDENAHRAGPPSGAGPRPAAGSQPACVASLRGRRSPRVCPTRDSEAAARSRPIFNGAVWRICGGAPGDFQRSAPWPCRAADSHESPVGPGLLPRSRALARRNPNAARKRGGSPEGLTPHEPLTFNGVPWPCGPRITMKVGARRRRGPGAVRACVTRVRPDSGTGLLACPTQSTVTFSGAVWRICGFQRSAAKRGRSR